MIRLIVPITILKMPVMLSKFQSLDNWQVKNKMQIDDRKGLMLELFEQYRMIYSLIKNIFYNSN